MTLQQSIDYAVSKRTCFACEHYCGLFTKNSAACRTGGLNPDAINPNALTAQQGMDNHISRTVRWDNTCERFTLAQQGA